MLVGLMSDSHDNMPLIKRAVDCFNDKEVSLVLHAGDFISPICAREFQRLKMPFWGVFGNNDGEKNAWYERISGWGHLSEVKLEKEIDGKKFVVMHEPRSLEELAKTGKYDVIVYGHTHKVDERKINGTLVINPGECGGWLIGRPTIALLEVSTMKVEIVDLL